MWSQFQLIFRHDVYCTNFTIWTSQLYYHTWVIHSVYLNLHTDVFIRNSHATNNHYVVCNAHTVEVFINYSMQNIQLKRGDL